MSTNTPNEKGTSQSRTYTVNDIAAILGIGRATAYKLANSGAFKTIRIGNMIRISRKSFEDWLKAEGLDDEMEYGILILVKLPQEQDLRQFLCNHRILDLLVYPINSIMKFSDTICGQVFFIAKVRIYDSDQLQQVIVCSFAIVLHIIKTITFSYFLKCTFTMC